jgi:translocator assembly and maintenance protein 41
LLAYVLEAVRACRALLSLRIEWQPVSSKMVHVATRRCLTAAGTFESRFIGQKSVCSAYAGSSFKTRASGSHRLFATEATEFRHQNAAPPPPPPVIPRLPEITSPSRVSSTVTSASSSSPVNTDSDRQQDITEASYDHGLPASFGRNQLDTSVRTIDTQLQADLEAILAEFKAPIRYAFAYGSGVFKQAGYSQTV